MRIRLVFDEGRLLRKEQRLSGLRRCWFLIKPEIATVADLASELFRRFQLQRNCPSGIFISMDNFVIPPWESTSFFREKDIISVHKRTCKKKKMITGGDDMLPTNRGEIIEKEAVPHSNGKLAIESQEMIEMRNNEVIKEGNSRLQTQLTDMGSKRKRKEVEKPKSSKKKKKPKLTTIEPPLVIIGGSCKETQVVPNQQSLIRASTPEQILLENTNLSDVNEPSPMAAVVATDNGNISNEKSQATPERDIQLEENYNENIGGPKSDVLPEKLPSRSARRKHTKRKLKKELRKQATENLQNEVSPNGTDKQTTENIVVSAQEPAVTHNLVVARVDRPGHIRFESEGEENDDDDSLNVQPNEPPMECFQWNGIINKTKGQKWGQDVKSKHNSNRYDTTSDWRNATIEDSFTNEKSTEKNTSDIEKATLSQVNFESLTPLTQSPKEGDLIAYRVVELSPTLCPDLSPFRVGEVKLYDLMSNMIILVPVPEHPIFSERKGDDAIDGEEDTPYQDQLSLYKEDGSLEIEFTSLLDVRLLRVNGSVSPSASSVSKKPNSRKAAMKREKSLYNGTKMTAASSAEVVKPISKEGSKDVDLMHDATGIEPNGTWEAHGENAGNTQGQRNGWDMAAEKCTADDLVKPSSTEGRQHVERNLFTDNSWNTAVQNDPEESIHDLPGTGPNSSLEANGEMANAGNTQAQQNGWEKWAPNTSTPSWSYRALRGSALGPTMAWLRGNDENTSSGCGGGRGGDGGGHGGRGSGRDTCRSRGRGHRRGRGN